jgi:putative nucleotidyltransferase with HDIG domain
MVVPYLIVAHALRRRFEMSQSLNSSLARLSRANIQFAAAMVGALDARDSYTAGHSAAVAVYARDMAARLGFNDAVCRRAHLSGLLHDIGKIGVPSSVLNKAGSLTPSELEMMQAHARAGAEILGKVDEFTDVAAVVEHHHERMDGAGYPDGLSGTDIPLLSRLIAVADAYSAMTTQRPYTRPMSPREAMKALEEGRGTQWDSEMVDTLLGVLADASDSYRTATLADFNVEVAVHYALHGHARNLPPAGWTPPEETEERRAA